MRDTDANTYRPQRWLEFFDAAIRETDETNLLFRIEEAMREIRARIDELLRGKSKLSHVEHLAMIDSVKALTDLQKISERDGSIRKKAG